MGRRRAVILVTDGDRTARAAVEEACEALGLRSISRSAGNPTPVDAGAIVDLVKKAPDEPVVIYFDDEGEPGKAEGELALAGVARHPDIDVLGAVAVASNTPHVRGAEVDASVDRMGRVVGAAVDKKGRPKEGDRLRGDTVDVLERLGVRIVVGLGDPGKMGGMDRPGVGAPVTRRALQEVLERAGWVRAGGRWQPARFDEPAPLDEDRPREGDPRREGDRPTTG